ncbi:cupredoxin family protein [Ramlibacter solisilvae]|uniref:Blue (type 1) copper domain-containing protein n=1 Tax=Ramlibacter tataouinensis TaxID=94132 RepID=A0A127JR11_9BURK|nr:cupredoxin family protein [Ramlibacter tataouinensis]AMO22426.1 hypothetical protein UC35_05325 [Ramlibacter tataouinensis]
MKHLGYIAAMAAALLASAAFAHGDDHHAAQRQYDPARVEATPFGQEGDPKKVTRTIRVEMNDRMRFVPDSITVRKGETVRFAVANKGAVLHEMVLGTAEDLAKHAEHMKKFPGMEHDEPSMVHVKPGARGEIVWQFTQPGNFSFACLIPGHYEAGMVGKVVVK